jgi:hypothetical protein
MTGIKYRHSLEDLIQKKVIIVIGMMETSYSEMKDGLRKETASATSIFCFGEHKAEIISKLIDRPVTDILQLPQSGLISMLCTYTYLYMFMHFITGKSDKVFFSLCCDVCFKFSQNCVTSFP